MTFTHDEAMAETILKMNRLSILETLILSMTHEINNAITLIKLETEPLEKPPLQKKIDQITHIINALQVYVKPFTISECQLNDCIKKSLELCTTLVKNRLTVECDFSQPPSPLKGNAHHLQQAFINIFICAVNMTKHSNKLQTLRIITQNLPHGRTQIIFKGIYFSEKDPYIQQALVIARKIIEEEFNLELLIELRNN